MMSEMYYFYAGFLNQFIFFELTQTEWRLEEESLWLLSYCTNNDCIIIVQTDQFWLNNLETVPIKGSFQHAFFYYCIYIYI